MIRRRCSTLLLENRERLRHTRCIHLGKLGGLEVVLLRIILRGNFFDLFTGIFGAHKFGVKIRFVKIQGVEKNLKLRTFENFHHRFEFYDGKNRRGQVFENMLIWV